MTHFLEVPVGDDYALVNDDDAISDCLNIRKYMTAKQHRSDFAFLTNNRTHISNLIGVKAAQGFI